MARPKCGRRFPGGWTKKRLGWSGLGDLIDAVIRALRLPRMLDEFSIDEEELDSIEEHSLEDRWVKTNPAPLDKAGVVEILRMVLTEKLSRVI